MYILYIYFVSIPGFEPRTCGLKVQCSKPTELYTYIKFFKLNYFIMQTELKNPSLMKTVQ